MLGKRMRPFQRRTIVAAVSGLFILVLLSTSVGAVGAPTAAEGTETLNIEAFEALPFVERTAGQGDGFTFDAKAAGPDRTYDLLLAAAEALDGIEVTVEGIDVLGAEERRAEDLRLSRHDKPVADELCPDLPSGDRSSDGSTVPYLGCDVRTGAQQKGDQVGGEPSATLETAIDQVMRAHFSGAKMGRTFVTFDQGFAQVRLPKEVGLTVNRLFPADGAALTDALLFTVYSNGSVDSVEFTVDGDCLAYAIAVGGDSCTVVSMTDFGGES